MYAHTHAHVHTHPHTQSVVGYYEVAMVLGGVGTTDCLMFSSPTWRKVRSAAAVTSPLVSASADV